MIKNNNNTPYLTKKISPTLLAFSAIVLLLLATSPMLFFNVFLQPVQAQTPITFRTPTPAVDPNLTTNSLTFDAQGTLSSDSTEATITKGTFQVTDTRSGQTLYNGSINSGGFTNSTDGENINAFGDLDYPAGGGTIGISTSCSASTNNDIQFGLPDSNIGFQGVVECSVGEVNAIAQPPSSSSLTGSSQGTDKGSGSSNSTDSNSKDGDRDGIPDSSDKCPHNSHHRCYKEAGTSSGTTHEQQQPASNRTGNQTR